jgi:hypothetical protein
MNPPYAFPKTMARLEPQHPRLVTLHDRVVARPRIAASYPHRGGWRSTSKTFFATIRSWKNNRRETGEEHKKVGPSAAFANRAECVIARP